MNPSAHTVTRDWVVSTVAAFLCVLEFAALTGCAAYPPIVLRDPVGPLHSHRGSTGMQGTLIVYSATRVATSDQSEYPVHTAYTIYDPGHNIIRRVDNMAGLFSQEPAKVSLPAGAYRVKALAVDSGYVDVPVVIEPRRTTVVDLDGTALPQGARASADSRGNGPWIRLPNGHVVGSQASCEPSSCK